MQRQKIRNLLLFISLLFFPVTIYYFSPYLILRAASEAIINGSFIVFGLMLIGSIFFGRLFCGYVCPSGGVQECTNKFIDKPFKNGKKNWIKYVVWVIWAGVIVFLMINQSHDFGIDFLYETDHGISISNIYAYIIYYGIIAIVLVPSLIWGNRAFCHCVCWMAPFMVIGTKIRDGLHLPGLHIASDVNDCISCKVCNKNCPMCLDVEGMVMKGKCRHSECILCGACIDSCPKKVLKYKFKPE